MILLLWPVAWIAIAVYLYRVEKVKSHVIGVGGSFFAASALVAVLGAGWAIVEGHPAENSNAPVSAEDACHDDWHKCTDNSMLVNHWSGETAASIACEGAADEQAKWGHPTFSTIPFPTFRGGNDYVKNGLMVISDKDTAFQNGFGAMERVTAVCAYDLNAGKVAELDVVPRD